MILIVDDKAENIFSLKRTLEYHGFEVDTADSGEEALKKILKSTYSLIILDVQMPGMDGFEVAEALSGYSKAKDIPIIFLSAVNTDKKFIAKGYVSGGVDYVTKPVDPDIFMLKVKTLHKLYEQNRELNKVQVSLIEEVRVRKQAEKTLQKNLLEQRSILESIPQIAFTKKPDGEIEFVNEQWYLYSISNKLMPSFHPDDKHISEKLHFAFKGGIPFAAEVRIRNSKTNEYRYHLLKMIPVSQDNVVHKWVGTFTDIQEQKTANDLLETKVKERTEELSLKNEELETKNHELQQFAYVASHDLKEPLRKIQIYSSVLKEQFPDAESEIGININRITDAAERMRGLINDLLDYSRLSMNSFFKKTDLKELANEVINDMDFFVTDKNAVIAISEIPQVEVVPGQMRQVFQNLLSNSLKFTRPGVQPIINITAETIAQTDMMPQSCRITISDNGIGFNEKYLGKIFIIFQRLNAREDYEGTGIGLAIVKKIIEKHNGSITAHSTEGEGATFIVTLPLKQDNKTDSTEQSEHDGQTK